MLPIINLGPLSLPAPQLIILIGLWMGSTLSERRAKKAGRNAESLFKIIWISILAGVLGARFSFVARNPGAFQGQWLSLFSLNQALLDPPGGILIGIVAGYFVALRNQIADWNLVDDLVPLFAVIIPSIHLANFASGSGYGTFSSLPWAIDLWGGSRHPVQLYYLAASLVVLYIIVIRKYPKSHLPGGSSLLFIILSAGYMVILNTFQDPAGGLIGGFRISQLLFWLIFTATLFFFNSLNPRREIDETD